MQNNSFTIISRGTFTRGDLYSEDTLIIEGGVEGNVMGSRVIVKKGGWIHGDIYCRALSIESGGIVDGDMKVSENSSGVLESQAGPAEELAQPQPHTLPSGEEEPPQESGKPSAPAGPDE